MPLSNLDPPTRLLLGPGPSNVHPRVIAALGLPIVGHLDPYYFSVMDDLKESLRQLFRTKNQFTIAISGSGSAAMEAAVANLVEEGDEVVVVMNGYFGARLGEVVSRMGGRVVPVTETWGKPVSEEAVENVLKNSKAKVVAAVNGETSTGVLQPLEGISRIARNYGAYFLVDAVTSLGGCKLEIDSMNIDVCYSGSQKCLNCPPGASPITANDRVLEMVRNRKTKVRSFYLDFGLLDNYWGAQRAYHHTGMISMTYALREAVRTALEEKLETRWARHTRNAEALASGVEALGLVMHVDARHRLSPLSTIRIPPEVEDVRVRNRLLEEHGIEIGGGLGVLKGKVWRVGLMGMNSREGVVMAFLSAFERSLAQEGYKVSSGAGVAAAQEYYARI